MIQRVLKQSHLYRVIRTYFDEICCQVSSKSWSAHHGCAAGPLSRGERVTGGLFEERTFLLSTAGRLDTLRPMRLFCDKESGLCGVQSIRLGHTNVKEARAIRALPGRECHWLRSLIYCCGFGRWEENNFCCSIFFLLNLLKYIYRERQWSLTFELSASKSSPPW